MINRSLEINGIKLENPFLAAPLAGITDAPTRCINREMGAAMGYSEMVSGKGLMYNNKNTEDLLKIYQEEKPVAYQIFGSEPEVMAYTAKQLQGRENALIDINMGCPVPKVVKNGEGSAMLKTPELIYDVVSATVANADKPVTVKIRIGWDDDSINCVEVAKIIEKAGASAVAVHGRTRMQYYSGKANWDAIKEVKENVGITVIGNGDIFSATDAMSMMEYTGCDLVMIGRGMLGNPWIFKQCKALWEGKGEIEKPSRNEVVDMMIRHFTDIKELKGERTAVNEMRKHVGWYTKGMPNSAAFRRSINEVNDSETLIERFEMLRNRG